MKTIKNTILLAVMFVLTGFTNLSTAQTLTIATAANFRDPMTEIITKFKAENTGVDIKPIFGSSGNLYNQLTNDAPFDLYFSANTKYPQKAFEAGLCYDAPKIYAIGQLVLWSKRLNVSGGLTVLQTGQVKRIAMANPELAPYGKSAQQCLEFYKLYTKIEPKLVTAENIAQTAQFAVTGNADVAFIAKSQLNMKAIKGQGSYFDIPEESYAPIEQAFVAIKREGNNVITQKFVAFLAKPEIQAIIMNYGYKLEVNE